MGIPECVPWRAIGETLGEGGQGQVHLVVAKNDPKGPKYALKVLRYVDSEQARERFQREIEAVKQLTDLESDSNDSAIIRILDHSKQDDEFQYYVMEYHDGAKTLADIIFSECNPFHGNALKSLNLFEQIVLAIGECEKASRPIIHRDIKPDNILVLTDGSIRLIDFGICHFEDGNIITLTDEGVGARDYTAPECESGSDDRLIGIYADLYSAAKVLWSAITSKKAFAREQPVFQHRSMTKMFPLQTETWHLTCIFEKTIRERREDRLDSARSVCDLIRELRYLIHSGYPPLEDTWGRCPSCGRRELTDFPQSHLVFGVSRQDTDFRALMCKSCGFGFLRNSEVNRSQVDRIKELT